MESRTPHESERPSNPANNPGANNPGEEFEGSRPGVKTAIFVLALALAVASYGYWPQIASALSLD